MIRRAWAAVKAHLESVGADLNRDLLEPRCPTCGKRR